MSFNTVSQRTNAFNNTKENISGDSIDVIICNVIQNFYKTLQMKIKFKKNCIEEKTTVNKVTTMHGWCYKTKGKKYSNVLI